MDPGSGVAETSGVHQRASPSWSISARYAFSIGAAIGTSNRMSGIEAPQSSTAPADALRTVPVIMRALSEATKAAARAVSATVGEV
jgi:hypothetical protein